MTGREGAGDVAAAKDLKASYDALRAEIGTVIIGQETVVE